MNTKLNDKYVGVVDLPEELLHEVEVQQDGGKTFVYRAKAFGLYFDDTAIRGRASLSCSLRSQTKLLTTVFTKPWGWYTIFKNDCKVETDEKGAGVKYIVHDDQLWSFVVESGAPYFVSRRGSRGETCSNRSSSADYRGALVALAANEGVLLRDQLLDEVFRPIDEKLMEIFNEVFFG